MKNILPKRLGLAGIVLSSVLGLESMGFSAENNQNRNPTNYDNNQTERSLLVTPDINENKERPLVPVKPVQKTEGWVSGSESLDKKLIGYNILRGDYLISDEGKESCEILGYLNLRDQESFLKGESFEEKPASKRFDKNGKVRYILPPGKYSIWTPTQGRVKEFTSKNTIDVLELGYESTEQEKDEIVRQYLEDNKAKTHSSIKVLPEQETVNGTLFRIHNNDGSVEYRIGPNCDYKSIEEMRKKTSWKYTEGPGVNSTNNSVRIRPYPSIDKRLEKSAVDVYTKGKAHSTTLVIKDDEKIKAVQPEPYESIESALERSDVEEYFNPNNKKQYKALFKEHVLPQDKGYR